MKPYPSAPLGDVCVIVGGGTPRRGNEAYFNGAIPWVKPTDITAAEDLFIEQTGETISELGLRESSARLVPAGTVLLTSRATIGYTAVASKPVATNQGLTNLICSERLHPEYVAFWLRGQRGRLIQLAGGTTFKEISKSALKQIEIPLPPLDEQRRIASILNRAARIERLRARAADRLREFIPALFIKMFGDPMQCPKKWELKTVGDLFHVRGGKRLPKGSKYTDHQTPYRYIRATDILEGKINDTDAKYINKDIHTRISSYVVDRFDTLLTIAGKIGVAAPVGEELAGANLTENAARLTPIINGHVNNVFLSTQLNSEFVQAQIRMRTGRVTIGKLAIERIKTMEVFIPPIRLQDLYADLIANAHVIFVALESGVKTASTLTKSLSTRLVPCNS